MHVGVVLPQAGEWSRVVGAARHAEESGADSIWVVDHLLGFPPERGIYEAFVVLSALASVTERVQLGAQVFCQSFRNPALFAKMAATLDNVSGGRFRLLIGAGWFDTEYQAFGYEFPPGSQRVDELRDTIHIIKGMLAGPGPFSYEGKHYRVTDVINAPAPVQSPLPIEVGAARDRMLRLTAELADGWNCAAAVLPALDSRIEVLAKACEENGRSVSDLKLSVQIPCSIDDEEGAGHPRLAAFNPQLGLVGSVDDAIARASELSKKGFSDFLTIVPPTDGGRTSIERLIKEVKPQI